MGLEDRVIGEPNYSYGQFDGFIEVKIILWVDGKKQKGPNCLFIKEGYLGSIEYRLPSFPSGGGACSGYCGGGIHIDLVDKFLAGKKYEDAVFSFKLAKESIKTGSKNPPRKK